MVEVTHLQPLLDGSVDTSEGPLPRFMIQCQGVYRFKVLERSRDPAGYDVGLVERMYDIEPEDEWNSPAQSEQDSVFPPEIHTSGSLIGLVCKTRSFVTNLLDSLSPEDRIMLESQNGPMPEDISDLPFWIADIVPLNPYTLYELLTIASVHERLEVICRWIDRTRSSGNE